MGPETQKMRFKLFVKLRPSIYAQIDVKISITAYLKNGFHSGGKNF
jgi:hypothetical protein